LAGKRKGETMNTKADLTAVKVMTALALLAECVEKAGHEA